MCRDGLNLGTSNSQFFLLEPARILGEPHCRKGLPSEDAVYRSLLVALTPGGNASDGPAGGEQDAGRLLRAGEDRWRPLRGHGERGRPAGRAGDCRRAGGRADRRPWHGAAGPGRGRVPARSQRHPHALYAPGGRCAQDGARRRGCITRTTYMSSRFTTTRPRATGWRSAPWTICAHTRWPSSVTSKSRRRHPGNRSWNGSGGPRAGSSSWAPTATRACANCSSAQPRTTILDASEIPVLIEH